MKKTLPLLLCAATTYQVTFAMQQSNALIKRSDIENQIKGRKFTFTDKKTGLNYNKENGKVFHDTREADKLLEEEMKTCVCVTIGGSCCGIGALFNQPLWWMAGAAILFSKMPHCCDTTCTVEEQQNYILDTKELEYKLKKAIANEKKQQ